ncbi:TIGR03668 family PPOX class F420-dependent oxidoreductase [Haloterrigena sp. SYSU A558-1]|uniref:TIGR03668 family PPOX class F420-dependent oxidoreductase n=1 Tax=Haloterrigena gelatinilytica TaxID=2741724 RepID=A0ABX2LLE6_9EURY|nr:TIGR03668 family PPOX class F420-dependent oxidoreductase [Haloterrigena gelatinilytica]NUC74462.1 TIGR03668 family PPOX class F420-dependent oxidoreductase [Haloterrigena gelatinilytica]
MTPEERAVLERARVASLATADGDGRPHAVPICYAVLEDADGDSASDSDRDLRLVSAIDEKPKSTRDLRRVRDARANPHATVLVDYYSEDWSRLAWVQVRGRATVIEAEDGDNTAHGAAVAALESKYDQYADHDLSERAVLEIRVERTLSWGALEEYAE